MPVCQHYQQTMYKGGDAQASYSWPAGLRMSRKGTVQETGKFIPPLLMPPSPSMAAFTAIIGSFRPIHMLVGTFLDGRQFGCLISVSFVVLSQCVVVLARARAVAWGVLCGETRGTQQSALVLTFISLNG